MRVEESAADYQRGAASDAEASAMKSWTMPALRAEDSTSTDKEANDEHDAQRHEELHVAVQKCVFKSHLNLQRFGH